MLIDDQKTDRVTPELPVQAVAQSASAPGFQQYYAEPPPLYESTSSGNYASLAARPLAPTNPFPDAQLPPPPPEAGFSSSPDGLPACFSRPPPAHLHYPHFPPVFLIAQGHHLNKGFPVCPPPSMLQPHPFITHDVNERDWTRLLGDIRQTATLTYRDARLARSVPVINILPVVGGLVEHAIRQHIKKRKTAPVSALVETWNHHFFHPRRMEVVLMQGPVRLSGDGPVPDAHVFRGRAAAAPSSASTSMSSLDDTADGGRGERAGKLRRRSDGRGSKGKAREEERKEKPDKTYRLVVLATI